MYHTIEFNRDRTLDLEISPRQPMERLLVRQGTRMVAQVRPYVVETPHGPIEVADLFFDDGSATRLVPFEQLRFVD